MQTRLLAVLQAALKAPGNWSRLRDGGLIQPGDLTSVPPILVDHWQERFTQLPPLAKEAVRQNPSQYLADSKDIVYRGSTSGSRSRSYTFFAGTAWNQRRLQSRQSFLAWWGIDQDTPIVNVASRLMPGRSGDWAIAGPPNADFMASLRSLVAGQSAVLRGYPSRLCEVASLLPKPIASIKGVICTGEPLFQYQRELLERAWQAPVINEYGCHEAAVRGFACPEGGRIHLDEQSCFFEIVDGSLVTTDLWNEIMPLVRYQCGDVVHPYDTPCPCGRPGLTVQVLGRVEDRIGTRQGTKLPGEVDMPALPGILHYRIQRPFPTLVAALIQADTSLTDQQADLPERSLQTWVHTTFGASPLNITHHSTVTAQKHEPETWSDRQWLHQITQDSLHTWLQSNAMPTGEARPLAQVLRSLLTPHVIGTDLPPTTQQQITALMNSPVAANPAIESMKVRILLLACSCTGDRLTSQAIYTQALARLPEPSPPHAATELDVLIPALHLPSSQGILARKTAALATTWSPDPLHVQHLLAAFEMALQRRSPATRPPIIRQLQPPLAVLVGDLTFWASTLTRGHLQHWATLLHGEAIAVPTASQRPQVSTFLAAWLSWRQTLVQEPEQAVATFSTLEAAAVADAEKARVQVERGYLDIVRGIPLEPAAWLPLLEAYTAGSISGTSGTTNRTSWLPILRALVQPLQQQGQSEQAYRCLLAASLPSRQQSAFERLTTQFNQKQSVLVDLCPPTQTTS